MTDFTNPARLSAGQRIASFSAAAVLGLLLVSGASTAKAQTRPGAFYTATLTEAAAATRTVAGGLGWSCAGPACTAPRGTSRPAIVCARLVRELGPVSAFAADGRALEAADLERCNASAR